MDNLQIAIGRAAGFVTLNAPSVDRAPITPETNPVIRRALAWCERYPADLERFRQMTAPSGEAEAWKLRGGRDNETV